MDDLIAFVAARLDEDEAIAEAAARTDDGHHGRWLAVHFGPCGFDARVDDHIARHDPARALREITADRALIAEYLEFNGEYDWQAGLRRAIMCRAMAWSDHPDYLPGWMPGAPS